MNIRFFNGKILTMKENEDVFDGEVWVENNKIVYVGKGKESDISFNREIDLEGNLLMPGFKNAHTHSAMTFLRTMADDLPLLDWLQNQVFPMEAKLTEEDVYWFSILGIMEYLTSGVTANFDMYLYPEYVAKASVDTGFRTVLCGGISDFVSSAEQLEKDYDKLNGYHDLISFKLGFHAEYTASDDLLEKISKVAQRKKAPVYTHNSESYQEVLQCNERTGLSPTERLNKFKIFEYGGGCYHCVHLSDNDIDIFKKKNINVVTNPGSNVKLASGIAPLEKIKENGINIGIGTDGPASNNCLDMFREMFLATGLQKINNRNASSLEAISVLKMATVNGAIAMELENSKYIEEGQLADLIVIDLNQPNMQPINNIRKNIVYSGSKSNIKLTMVDGKILYENGRFFIGFEPKKIYEEVERRIKILKGED